MTPQLYALVVASATLFVLVAVGVMVVLFLRTLERRRIEQRIAGADVAEEPFRDIGESRLLQRAARRGQEIDKAFDSKGESAQLLAQAGWRSSEHRLLFYAFQALTPVILLLLVLVGSLLGVKFLHGVAKLIEFGAVAVILGFLIPRWVLRAAATARTERLRGESSLFVHLLIMMFEAGLSTRQALASIAQDGPRVLPAMGADLAAMVRQLDAGGELADVFGAYTKAMDISELSTVFGILRQVDRYGGEIRQPLQEAQEIIEERRNLTLRERVNKMSGRMTVAMVMFFFPALLIFVGAPATVAMLKVLGNMAGR